MTKLAERLRPLLATGGSGRGVQLWGQLEERVQALVGRYRDAQAALEVARRALAERERRIGELEKAIAAEAARREQAARRVDRLLAELDRLERRALEGADREVAHA